MPELDTRTVGNGPKRTAAWLEGVPVMLAGLDEWPKVGDVIVIDGESWRLVEISDRWVCEWEAN